MRAMVIGILLTLVLIGGGVFLITKTNNSATLAQSQNTKVSVDKTSFDWGNIGYGGGKVNAKFNLTNSGSAPLKLANVNTSCMCTNAKIVIDDQDSPWFGMHQKSNWTGTIEPGKNAQLVVEFDPAFHGPSGIGKIERQVSVGTNDPNQKQLSFSLTGNVTP